MKPYTLQVLAALGFVLVITACELYRPMLVAEAIDTHIEGYDRPYGIVSTSELSFRGQFLSRETSDATSYAQLLLYEDNYYYFTNLTQTQSDTLTHLAKQGIHDVQMQGEQLHLMGMSGVRLHEQELKQLRHTDFQGILVIGFRYVFVLLINLAAAMSQLWILQKMGQNIIFTIREQLFHHVHSLPLRFFDTHPIGRIVTRISNDAEALHELFASILVRLFRYSLKIIALAAAMLYMDVTMALYSFLLVPLIVVLTVIFKRLSRRIHHEIRTKISLLNTFLSEHLSGMRLIQIFANEQLKYEEFAQKSKELYHANRKQLSVFAIFQPTIFFISEIALALMLYLGGKNVLTSVLSFGTLYVFINYISGFYEPIQSLAEQFSTLQNALASAEKIFAVLDETNPIQEPSQGAVCQPIKGKIEFRHVWFAYEEEHYVLRDVSFVIEPGQRVAFVGATGAGKSSILSLIGRYYEIQKGQILIDDVDIRQYSLAHLRSTIGQMQQDVFLFTGDIASNIRLLNDSITDEQVQECARLVHAADFIEHLPQRYHEVVSERGSTLSSGQRQLLSFARTLAFAPCILVMDEATANIDTESEQWIQAALERLMEGRTTIMVAHRLSTIQHADHIIVLHKGKVRESGSHQE
ncbi:MAG: ABC transporter ATP-binding protein, partial [Erysipelotrichaceae bacterium]|nr:ABC transporter ATP-binding protein [Erysipelotrichaceae bacterium]